MAYVKTNWENTPATTSPINSTNLNKIEDGLFDQDARITNTENAIKYLTATADTNGDFKINVTNSLETNMILNIEFPAATDNTDNARLSIDDGTTYKNIYFRDGSQALASHIENKRIGLYWNAINWIIVETPSIDIVTGEEVATNETIDGDTVYVKRISLGALPNSTVKTVASGLSSITLIKFEAVAISSTTGTTLPLPYISTVSLASCVNLYFNGVTNNITIITGTDRISYNGYVNLYYTKD